MVPSLLPHVLSEQKTDKGSLYFSHEVNTVIAHSAGQLIRGVVKDRHIPEKLIIFNNYENARDFLRNHDDERSCVAYACILSEELEKHLSNKRCEDVQLLQ